jgi:hypothetical protein
MVPARILDLAMDGQRPVGGEVTIFEALRNEPGTEDWVVLHSVNIPRHIRRHEGEADFVILAPGLGVLILEIKSHLKVARYKDGYWRMGNNEPEQRGPFVQAADAMHSIKKAIFEADQELRQVPFMSAVCFPNCTFGIRSVEWEDWQVVDRAALQRQSLRSHLVRVLRESRARYSRSTTCAWFRESEGLPTKEQCDRILRLIRPAFEQVQSPKDARRAKKAELVRMTEEQYFVLDAWEENDRLLISGPAGTGKTLLAIEAARRAAADGERVLLLCFNRLLGDWLRSAMSELGDDVDVDTLPRLMMRIAGVDVGHDRPPDFWANALPELALSELLDENDGRYSFDSIIIDEAQDLTSNPNLDVIEALISMAPKSPKLLIFGDFERQAIFGTTGDPKSELRARFPGMFTYPLHVNCRNTPIIGEWVGMLSSLEARYRGYRRSDDGSVPDLQLYSTAEDQAVALVAALEDVRREGFEVGDITVLSPLRDGVAKIVPEPWRSRLRPIADVRAGHAKYSTIHAFKGLESPVVAVTDIDQLGSDHWESLLYVAMTRATDRLIVLMQESNKDELAKRLTRKAPHDD